MADETDSPAEPAPRPPDEPEVQESATRSAAARPRFLLKFPDQPELKRLSRAFELGNYAEVRKGAPALLDNEDQAVRKAARELLTRIEPDPLMKYLLALAISLFVLIVWYTYGSRGH